MLRTGDVVMALAPDETIEPGNRLFAARPPGRRAATALLGDFALDAETPVATLVDLYGLEVPAGEAGLMSGGLLGRRLGRAPVVGDRVRIGPVDLIVRRLDGNRIAEIGIALEHEHVPFEELELGQRLRRLARRLLGRPQSPP
jgi:cell volume regulation protein A